MIGLGKHRKSLSGILSSFNQTLNDLKSLRERNADQVSVNSTRISLLSAHNQDLSNENVKVARIEEKLTELVS